MFRSLLLIFIICSVYILPQNVKDSDFKLGLDYLNAYQYENALKEFTRIAEDETNPNYTASIFFKGKILFMLNRSAEAESTYSFLYNNFPDSKYIDEARIVSAKYMLQARQYLNAFNELCLIIKNTSSQEYMHAAKVTGKKISSLYLSKENLDTLSSLYKTSRVEPFLLICHALKDFKNGNIKEADSLQQVLVKNFPNSDESNEVIANGKGAISNENVIAALLPLTTQGKNDISAEEILEGIKFAIDEYNQTSVYKTGLLISDTERDSAKINEYKSSLRRTHNIKAIIGPVYSDEVRYALESFKDLNIPLLSPTATENDLTKKYPAFIQANPSFSFRGKIMAQYIYYVENKRNMAILSSSTGYSSQIATEFKNEFKKLGGKIIVDEKYISGSYEFTKQVNSIAAKIKSIEGLYLPITDKSDAAILLSQLENSAVDINIYGNQDWYVAKGFESSSNLSNKLIFSSDYYIDYNDPAYIEFSRTFKEKTGVEAGRNALYGYDAAKCLLSVIDGASSRESIIEKLNSGMVFQGYHNNFCFDSNRMNKFLNIIRYKDGIFELIDRFKSGH